MRYKHTNRPGFWFGFIDFCTAGLFLLFYMPLGGLQDELGRYPWPEDAAVLGGVSAGDPNTVVGGVPARVIKVIETSSR